MGYRFRGFCQAVDMSRRYAVSSPGYRGYFTMFGRLRAAREMAKLHQGDLAEKLGVHRTSVLRWERDDIRTIDKDMVMAWGKICGVDPEWLIQGGPSGNVALDWKSAQYGYPRKEEFRAG